MRWKLILGILAGVILAGIIGIIIFVSTYDVNKFKPQIIDITHEYTGRKLTIGGDIKLAVNLHPTLELTDLAFQNAPWGSRPEMLNVKQVQIQISLLPLIRGKVEIGNLILIEPDYIIETDKSGKTNMQFDIPEQTDSKANGEETATEEVFAFLGLKDFTIENGKFTFLDHRDNSKNELIIEKYTRAAADFRAESEMKLVGAFNNFPLKAEGKVGALQKIFDPNEKWNVDLTAEAFESNITINGSILDLIDSKGYDLKISVKGDDLASLEKITEKPLPIKGPFNLSGHLAASTFKNIQLSDISVMLGQSKISGSLSIDQTTEKPMIKATLTSQTLDLRPIIGKDDKSTDTGKKEPTPKKELDKVFSSTPFQFDALNQINASISLNITQILLPKMAIDNFKTNLSLQNGHLIVKPLESGIGGGKLIADLDLMTKGSHGNMTANITASKIDLGSMLQKLQISNDLDGTLDLTIKLKGQGNSMAELMAGLNGDTIASIGEGRLPASYLNLIGGNLASTITRILNPFGDNVDRAHINCAVVDFHIVDGMAKSDIIMVDDAIKTVLSHGTVDLKTEKIDFHVETKPKEGLGTKETGKLSVSLKELSKPFKLGGTLANPTVDISITSTAVTVGAVLLGPVGWTYLLVSGSGANATPCAQALKIAGEGEYKGKHSSTEQQKGSKTDSQTTGEKKEGGVMNKIKGIFTK